MTKNTLNIMFLGRMFLFLCTYVCFPLWKYDIGHISKTTYYYRSVGILVGILSTIEFGRNSLRFGGKPFFPQNGGWAPQKGGHDPPFEEKRGSRQKIIPKCTNQVFLWYWFGKYQEIPTDF
jgi:hypothetical protein